MSHLLAWKPAEGHDKNSMVCCNTCQHGWRNSGSECEKGARCIPEFVTGLANHLKKMPNYKRNRLRPLATGTYDAETARRVIRFIEAE